MSVWGEVGEEVEEELVGSEIFLVCSMVNLMEGWMVLISFRNL